MKLHETILATIDKVIDALQPRVAYATATEFAYASDCWGCSDTCNGTCAVACGGGCYGGCEGGCYGGCYNSCESDSYNSCSGCSDSYNWFIPQIKLY